MNDQPLKFEQEISVDSAQRSAVDRLAEATPLSKQKIKLAMQKGAVWLTHGKNNPVRLRRATRIPAEGDKLSIYYDEDILSITPETAILIADEGAYSIWRKPYGMLSQGSKWSDHCTIHRWAEQHLQPQRTASLVHRLDRAASGLILIAHKKSAAKGLSELFRNRDIDKRYHVIVHDQFPESVYPRIIDSALDDKPAKTTIKLLSFNESLGRSLLEVRIETGRKHQIRRHLKKIGFSVVGDRLYGEKGDTEDLQLMAFSLSFLCPLTQQKKHYELTDSLLDFNP